MRSLCERNAAKGTFLMQKRRINPKRIPLFASLLAGATDARVGFRKSKKGCMLHVAGFLYNILGNVLGLFSTTLPWSLFIVLFLTF